MFMQIQGPNEWSRHRLLSDHWRGINYNQKFLLYSKVAKVFFIFKVE